MNQQGTQNVATILSTDPRVVCDVYSRKRAYWDIYILLGTPCYRSGSFERVLNMAQNEAELLMLNDVVRKLFKSAFVFKFLWKTL